MSSTSDETAAGTGLLELATDLGVDFRHRLSLPNPELQRPSRQSDAQLIAPRRGHQSLPSLSELNLPSPALLRQGRGRLPPQVPPPSPPESVYYEDLNGEQHRLAEYWIRETPDLDKKYVMIEVRNQNFATWHRRTRRGRHLKYELQVIQQPSQARACGNGSKSQNDRRPIDPPPVVKLNIFDDDADITGIYEANFVLYASIQFSRPIKGGNIWAANHSPGLNQGTNAAGPVYLTKPSDAVYFLYPDLSVRNEGWYRLRFDFFELPYRTEDWDCDSDCETREGMWFREYVYSAPFQVFSAKKFPGLGSSTALSLQLAEQGCRVRIRKEIRLRKKASTGKKEEDHRSLRANDTIPDGQAHLYRPHPEADDSIDTMRPSADSPVSSIYTGSRHQSSRSSLPSPVGYASQHHSNRDFQRPSALFGDWAPSYRGLQITLPPPGCMPPPLQRPSLAISPSQQISNPMSTVLPGIAAMITPSAPARPENGLYDTTPLNGKRTARSSDDASATYKDFARPSLTNSASVYPVSGNYTSGSASTCRPLAGVNDPIEVDAEDEASGSDSDESYGRTVSDLTWYRRADGSKTRPRRHIY